MKNSVIPAGEISSDVFDSYLLQLSDKVKNNSMELDMLKQSVEEKEARNLFLENTLSEKDRDLSDMKVQIRNLEAFIEAGKTEFAGIKDELSRQNNEIAILKKIISGLCTTPDGHFTDNCDGTVTDNKTGLMWKKYHEGASGSNDDSGSSGIFTWDNAMQRAAEINSGSGFAGYNDWRLPDIHELRSIIDRNVINPYINQEVFPATPSASFWSSSPVPYNAGYVWILHFANGGDARCSKSAICYVRLVRGGQ